MSLHHNSPNSNFFFITTDIQKVVIAKSDFSGELILESRKQKQVEANNDHSLLPVLYFGLQLKSLLLFIITIIGCSVFFAIRAPPFSLLTTLFTIHFLKI